MSENWHKVRTKVYYAEYRREKVGEIVMTWFGPVALRDGQIIVKYPNGKVTIADSESFFLNYEEVKE